MIHESLGRRTETQASSERSFGFVFAAVFAIVALWPNVGRRFGPVVGSCHRSRLCLGRYDSTWCLAPGQRALGALRSAAALDRQPDCPRFHVLHCDYSKWLEKFIRTLEENREWIRLLTFGEYLEQFPPQGRAYLPPASYDEMMEWALPPLSAIAYEDLLEEVKREKRYEKYRPYLRGGIWENFLVKYPESNHMHKKMLRVSQKVHRALQSKFISPKDFPPPPALRSLWRAQDSCAYWHGLFGGLHLNYLRHAVYQNLIAAERLAEVLERGAANSCTRKLLTWIRTFSRRSW